MPDLVSIIVASEPAVRNQSLDSFCSGLSREQLLQQCVQLDAFRRQSENLYERVRALFFLYAIHRFHLPRALTRQPTVNSLIPFKAYEHLLQRRFEEAIDQFLVVQQTACPSDGSCTLLVPRYPRHAIQPV